MSGTTTKKKKKKTPIKVSNRRGRDLIMNLSSVPSYSTISGGCVFLCHIHIHSHNDIDIAIEVDPPFSSLPSMPNTATTGCVSALMTGCMDVMVEVDDDGDVNVNDVDIGGDDDDVEGKPRAYR